MATRAKVERKIPETGLAGGPPAPVRTVAAYVGAAAAILGGGWAIITNGGNLYGWVLDRFTTYDLAGTWCLLDEITGDPGTPHLGERSGFKMVISKSRPGYYMAKADSVAFQGRRSLSVHVLVEEWPVTASSIVVSFTQTTTRNSGPLSSDGRFEWQRDGADLRGVMYPLGGASTGSSVATRATDPKCEDLIAATAPDPVVPPTAPAAPAI